MEKKSKWKHENLSEAKENISVHGNGLRFDIDLQVYLVQYNIEIFGDSN